MTGMLPTDPAEQPVSAGELSASREIRLDSALPTG